MLHNCRTPHCELKKSAGQQECMLQANFPERKLQAAMHLQQTLLSVDADRMHTCPAKGGRRHDIAHQQHQNNAKHGYSSTQSKGLCSIVCPARQDALQQMKLSRPGVLRSAKESVVSQGCDSSVTHHLKIPVACFRREDQGAAQLQGCLEQACALTLSHKQVACL